MKVKDLEMIKYYTMNSWNQSTSPAFNLKVYKVIPESLRNKVFELMEADSFYDGINCLIEDFNYSQEYKYQAGFNGRSGGYLVLYTGGIKDGKVFCMPGRGIEEKNVPKNVLKAFKKLAVDIVNHTIYMAENCTVSEEEYTISKTRKVIS